MKYNSKLSRSLVWPSPTFISLTKPKGTLLVRLEKHNSDTTSINGGTDVTVGFK